jgi:riboflavin synthase
MIWSSPDGYNPMFTGLIQTVGRITRLTPHPDGTRLHVHCPNLVGKIAVDDSIATNGVCLTAESVDAEGFSAFVMPVTLEKTALADLHEDAPVNLELALRFGDRLGGHLVQGHVNGVGRIRDIVERGDSWWVSVDVPLVLRRYLILEGSIAIDGISLTIAALDAEGLSVSIIPHTLANTNLRARQTGDAVNIEVDVLAKTIEGLLRADPTLRKAWSHLESDA